MTDKQFLKIVYESVIRQWTTPDGEYRYSHVTVRTYKPASGRVRVRFVLMGWRRSDGDERYVASVDRYVKNARALSAKLVECLVSAEERTPDPTPALASEISCD